MSCAPGSDQDDFAWRSSSSRRMVQRRFRRAGRLPWGRGTRRYRACPGEVVTGSPTRTCAKNETDMNAMAGVDAGASWYLQRATAPFERPQLTFDLDVDV